MTKLPIILSILACCLNICIPLSQTEIERKATSNLTNTFRFILHWTKRKTPIHNVPIVSLSTLSHFAGLMEREIILLYHKQITSLELSEKLHLLQIELNGTNWIENQHIDVLMDTMGVDCFRKLWFSKLFEGKIKIKQNSLTFSAKALLEELDDFTESTTIPSHTTHLQRVHDFISVLNPTFDEYMVERRQIEDNIYRIKEDIPKVLNRVSQYLHFQIT